jgi:hypothetical protein
MKRNGILLLLALAIGSFAQPAHAIVSLSAVGGVSDGLTNFTASDGTTTKEKVGYGGGLLLGLRLEPRWSLETGGIFLVNKFRDISAVTTTNTNENSIYVPADLRYYVDRHFSIAGGVYYNKFTQQGFGSDYGWEAGIRLGLTRLIFIDGRYSDGLKDQGGGMHYSNILGLLGIHLGAL